MRTLWMRLTCQTLVTVKGKAVQVRSAHSRQRLKIVDALATFLPTDGHVTITGRRVKVHGALCGVEQRVRNSILAVLR